MNLRTSTLKFDETGEPLHIQQGIGSHRASGSESGDLVGLDYIGTDILREFRIKLGGIL